MEESRLHAVTDQYKPSYDAPSNLKQIVEIIARALVDDPESVSVNEVGGRQTAILEIKVAKADIGKIIGRQGRTASSLRVLLGAVAAKENKRAWIEIVE